MTTPPPHPAVIQAALEEARRRAAMSERDLSSELRHFEDSLAAVCDAWGLTARAWFGGGAGMPVLDTEREDGTAAVLKIAAPDDIRVVASVMGASGGRGYARVLDWEPSTGALLTERLGADLWSETTRLEDQAGIVAPLLVEAWQVPLDAGRVSGSKAAGLEGILDDLGRRYAQGHDAALRMARSYVRQLAAAEQADVVCHGDPHAGNVLRRDDGWAFIDPDGFVGERAYDLGVVLRDACREFRRAEELEVGDGVALVRSGCTKLASLAGVDEERVWRWGFVERVTTGLYLAWHGHGYEAATFLGTASEIVRQS